MKIIMPAEISAKIMTLIDDAEKELIIVSPYNVITNWDKLINRIKKAQGKKINISWYSRKNHTDEQNIIEVKKNFGIDPILIDDLHAKIYMNERSAIFTSMNMSKVSDDKSIDLGYSTESELEYDEIKTVFKKYIKPAANVNEKELAVVEFNKIKNLKDISNKLYINKIHEHILTRYGTYRYKFNDLGLEGILEYNDFMKRGVNVQIIPFSKDIRIQICLPNSHPAQRIFRNIFKLNEFQRLKYKDELEYIPAMNNNKNIIKYYYKGLGNKVAMWDLSEIQNFLDDMDVLLDIYSKLKIID
jgi:hypothetical protein